MRVCVCVCERERERERECVCFSFSVRRKRSVICLLVSSRPSVEVRVLQIPGEGGTPCIILMACAPKSALFRCQKVTVRVLLS